MNQRETGTDPRERTWNPHDLAARAPPRPRTRHGGRRHGAQRRAGAMSNWAPEQAVLALRLQPSNVELISLVASARMQDGDRKGALKVLRLQYNPHIDDEGKVALLAAAAKYRPLLSVTLS